MQPLIVIDEAGLGQYVEAGLALDLARDMLQRIVQYLHAEGAWVGLHCCADPPWALLFEIGVDVISFDVFRYARTLVHSSKQAATFLMEGGCIAWGITPSDQYDEGLTPEVLARRLEEIFLQLERNGCDPSRLAEQSLVTTSCGLGKLSERENAHLLTLTREVADAVHTRSKR